MPKEKPSYQALEKQIIELKKAQVDSAMNEDNRYKMLFDSMTEMLQTLEVIYDDHGQPFDFYIREVNLSFAEFVGKTKDQLINKKTSSVFNVVEENWLTSFASVDKTGVPISFENYGVEFDKYYYVTAWKVSDNRVGVSYTDITEKKRNEKNKSKSDKIKYEFDQAQKIAQVGNWLFYPATQKPQWSDEMFRIWGFDPESGTPEYNSIIKRIHADDFELYNYSVTQAATLGTPYTIEFRIYAAEDKQKTIKAICQPVFGASGEVASLKGTNQDITSQKLFEEDLIKHQRLIAIGEMASSIAHDFNNSLQAMMGNLQIVMLKDKFSGNTFRRLNNIIEIISDVAGRVAILQHFGDTEHDSNKAEPINFNTIIAESLKQARPLWKDNIEKQGFTISVVTDFGDIPEINGNRGELKSALYNLIKNSVEAMPEGGDLIIETGINTAGVFVNFTDTGSGMDSETKLKIFQPFYTTKGLTLGRGLGMSGVYSTIKTHKGSIAVKFSELGKGTTIEMVFPIAQQGKIKNIVLDKPEETESLAILWVDDDPLIRESARELLEFMGNQCETADSGKSALQYLSENTCDIVFTDIGMPEMNGWELVDAIRSKFGKTIKIIVVSGWDIEEKLKNKHDVNLTLQKPFKIEQLTAILVATSTP